MQQRAGSAPALLAERPRSGDKSAPLKLPPALQRPRHRRKVGGRWGDGGFSFGSLAQLLVCCKRNGKKLDEQEEEPEVVDAAEEEEERVPSNPSSHPSQKSDALPGMVDPLDSEQAHFDVCAELHAAAFRNDALRVRLLLSGRIPGRSWTGEKPPLPSPDILNEKMETPLVVAAKGGAAAACAALLDGKANPLARDRHGNYFGDAVWPNERGPSKFGSKAPLKSGERPGRSAVYQLRLDGKFDQVLSEVFPMTRYAVVRAIAGALQDYHGKSAMVVAANEGNSELAALLLMNSAALPQVNKAKTTTSGWGAPAPAMSSRSGLPLAGASTCLNPDRGQALLAACSQREWHTAQVLLAAGVGRASIDSTKGSHGYTALHLAASAGEDRVVRRLLDAGASTKVFDEFGRLPLHEAALGSHASTVRTLLDGRADPRSKSNGFDKSSSFGQTQTKKMGKTAFEFAAMRGDTNICMMLRECGGEM